MVHAMIASAAKVKECGHLITAGTTAVAVSALDEEWVADELGEAVDMKLLEMTLVVNVGWVLTPSMLWRQSVCGDVGSGTCFETVGFDVAAGKGMTGEMCWHGAHSGGCRSWPHSCPAFGIAGDLLMVSRGSVEIAVLGVVVKLGIAGDWLKVSRSSAVDVSCHVMLQRSGGSSITCDTCVTD